MGGERILRQLPPFQKEAFECQFTEFIFENGSVLPASNTLFSKTDFLKLNFRNLATLKLIVRWQ